jgi:hypothetical protein
VWKLPFPSSHLSAPLRPSMTQNHAQILTTTQVWAWLCNNLPRTKDYDTAMASTSDGQVRLLRRPASASLCKGASAP